MQGHLVLFQSAEHAQLCTQTGCKTKLPWSYRLGEARPCSTHNLSRVLKTCKHAHINGGRLFRQGLGLHYHQDRHDQARTRRSRGGPHAACSISSKTLTTENNFHTTWCCSVRMLLLLGMHRNRDIQTCQIGSALAYATTSRRPEDWGRTSVVAP